MKPRVRFAPSPTGQLHLGGARTALSNYLFTKNQGGKFLVRIEDTDLKRSKKEYTDQICQSLDWLGLKWDEELVYQSSNTSVYKSYIDALLKSNKAYMCFASKKELDEIRKKSNSFHYPGIWRNRDLGEIKSEIKKGSPFTVRLKTPKNGKTSFKDLIYGNISVDNNEIDDFIISRSDGSPVYNFTNVIDDNSMKITHVIRGEDHVSNTPKQILIYNALGFEVPTFAHLPMILGEDKKRLSKRHGAAGVNEYESMGYQPDALLNYLALLGWNPGTAEEIFDLDSLVKNFDISKVQKKSATYDQKKFNWISSQHLMKEDSDIVLKRLASINPEWGESKRQDYLIKLIDLMKPRSNSLTDLIDKSQYFFSSPKEFDSTQLQKIWKKDTVEKIIELKSVLDSINSWVAIELESNFKRFTDQRGIGIGKVMQPMRFIICGSLQGPSLFDLMELIGKEESLKRINFAINEF
ncbi:MAG: glutamate--tRNA ligase [Candidatus Neomarinimicrobiota bacterium]